MVCSPIGSVRAISMRWRVVELSESEEAGVVCSPNGWTMAMAMLDLMSLLVARCLERELWVAVAGMCVGNVRCTQSVSILHT